MDTTLTTATNLPAGTRVTIYGQPGTVRYMTYGSSVGGLKRVGRDAWIGVQLDGEKRVDEWQPSQVEVVS